MQTGFFITINISHEFPNTQLINLYLIGNLAWMTITLVQMDI